MKLLHRTFAALSLCALFVGVGGGGSVLAAEKTCTNCHGDDEAVLPIGKTKHGTQADTRTPLCVNCHGDSVEHMKKSGDVKPDRTFDKKSVTPVAERNAACLTCHNKDSQRSHWMGSTHEARDVACASCHTVHNGKDKVRDRQTQAEVCFTCHKEQRAQANKPSHHPVIEGKMTCSDCHNPHGSVGPSLMKRNSVVETCYTCHMEKRGPFVHNHQPVSEDCSNCHNPHGTTAESMLKSRPPFLCNTCHTPHGPIQPALVNGTPGVVGWWNPSVMTQGKSCLNCHTQIHGSNNPSPASPSAQRLFR